MGFSFNLNPSKAITRALGLPDKVAPILDLAIFPLGVTHGASILANQAISMSSGKPANQSQLNVPNQQYGGNPYNVSFQAPSYQAPYYSGGGAFDAYSYQPTYNPYENPGGSPWGYSMGSPTYSTMPYQGYSAPADRSWETLTSLAEVALPFFL